MAQIQPTPPVQGGAGNVTCLPACELSDNNILALRIQFLRANYAIPFDRAQIVAPLIFGGVS